MKQGYRNLFGFLALAMVALALTFAGQASAQVISGDLVGTVLDKTGAAVPGASVEAVNVETGVKYAAEANATGEYRFNNLPVGTYNVSAWANNFAKTTVNAFRIELNKTSTLSITLEIKGAVTSIEVSGAAVALDTTTATVSNTFDQRLSADLPAASVGSGVLNLSLLSSGVASSGGVGAGSGPSVGGQRPRNNNFTIEGVDNNSKSVTGPLVYIPNDAVEEVSVLQNHYSPEFGHSSGGQFNTVVKGGSNAFHGGAYAYSRNRNFDAVDVSLKNQGILDNPRYDNNRVGGDIGGPILKNKLFFFGTLEYNPLGQASVSASALCSPTAGGYTTLSGISGVSANNLAVLQQYSAPAATATGCDSVSSKDPAGNASANQIFVQNPSGSIVDSKGVHWTGVPVGVNPVQAPNFTNYWAVIGSMDYNVSTSDQLRGRYIYNRAVGLDASPNLPAFFLPAPTKNHLVTINEYHTFRPNLTNEFRIGYNRYTNVTDTGNFKFSGLDSFPNLEFFDINLQVGPDPNGPQFTIQNLYQMADALSWTKGRHTIKVGIEGRKYISPQSFTQRSRGDYDYVTLDLYLRDQTPDFLAERSLGNPVYYGDQSSVYWFANDEWRIRPNLTFNAGLRYEYTTIPVGERLQSLNQAASVPGLIDFSEPKAARNNWGPRVGVAYSPGTSGRTSIRAGAGISYDVLYDNIGILSLPPQLSGTVDCSPYTTTPDPGCPFNGSFLASGGIPPTPGGLVTFPDIASQRAATANHVVVDQLDPKSIQWTLGVQHTFWKDYTVEVRYLGTRGLHLNTQERINRQAKTSSSLFLPTYTSAPTQAALDALPVTLTQINAQSNFRPDFAAAGFNATSLVQFTPNGDSIYHGLATQVTKRMNHGLQFIGSYTWSHTIDDSTADFFTTVLTPRRTQDFQNLQADRSNSALDRRHRFTLAVLYDLPYFQHSNWAVKNIIGNWVIAPVYTYQTGEWATVESNQDVNRNGDAAGDRVIFNPSGVSGTGSGVKALTNSGGATVAYLALDPTAQYIRGGLGSLPDVGRNTLLTRPINNFDMTAVKRFSLTERCKIEFSANAFNLLNHPQFVPGYLNDIASIGYTGSGVSNYLTPGNAAFNHPDQTFASNARTLQLGLKVKF